MRTGDRKQSRSIEYKHVFDNFLNDIKTMPCVNEETTVIMIAGDLFHNKGRMETEGTMILFDFINKLLNMAPVIVIAGNHDFRQENPDYIDTVDVLAKAKEYSSSKYPLHYLKTTGHYIFNNIGIGLCSVKDTLRKFNTAGIVSELPPFPDPKAFNNVDCLVALFHGSISQSALPNGRSVDSVASGYPLAWMEGYNIAVLGDNHKQQVHRGLNDTLAWGYPGSLIQQDVGEPLFGHGYIVWDTVTHIPEVHHVKNDYGSVTVFCDKKDDVYICMQPKQLLSINEALKHSHFPKLPQVRMVSCTGGMEQYILKRFKSCDIAPSSIKYCKQIGKKEAVESGMEETDELREEITLMQDVNSPVQWDKFMKDNSPALEVAQWIYNPGSLLMRTDIPLPDLILSKINARNDMMQDALDSYNDTISAGSVRYSIHLKHMEWSYVMCFGDNNYVDFESLEGSTTLLNGANASGKSSFLDVLCIAIFGEPTASRCDTTTVKMTSSIIHNDKPISATSGVVIVVNINNNIFEIRRNFSDNKNDTKKDTLTVVTQLQDDTAIIVAEGTTGVDSWIKQRFGTITEFMMSSVICQMDNKSFFFQKSDEQKLLLDKSLNLDSLASYQNFLDEARKAYNAIVNEITTYISGFQNSAPSDASTIAESTARLQELKISLQAKSESVKVQSDKTMTLLVKLGEIQYEEDDEESEEPVGSKEDLERELTEANNILATQTPYSNSQKLEAQIIQGKLETRCNALQSDQKRLNITDAEVQDSTVIKTKSISSHMKKQPPISTVTREYITNKQAAYKTWLKAHPHEDDELGLDGIQNKLASALVEKDALLIQLSTLNEHPVVKPTTSPNVKINNTDTDLSTLRKSAAEAQSDLDKHLQSRPAPVRSRAVLNEIIQKYKKWSVKQDSTWLTDIASVVKQEALILDELATLEKEGDNLSSNCISKPSSARIKLDGSLTEDDLNELKLQLQISVAIIPKKSKSDFTKWKADLAKWTLCETTVAKETSAALRKSAKGLAKDIEKRKELDALKLNLTSQQVQLAKDIAILTAIPFNKECWACCANHTPSQQQLVEKQTTLGDVEKQLLKIDTKLAKLSTVTTYTTSLAHIERQITTRDYYEQNIALMESAISDWTSSEQAWAIEDKRLEELAEITKKISYREWHAYDMWSSMVASVRTKRDEKRASATLIRKFLTEAVIITNKDIATTELEACTIYEEWETKYSLLMEAVTTAAYTLWTTWYNLRANINERQTVLCQQVQDIEELEQLTLELNTLSKQEDTLTKWENWRSTLDALEHASAVADWKKLWQAYIQEHETNKKMLDAITRYDDASDTVNTLQNIIWKIDYNEAHDELEGLKIELESIQHQITTLECRLTECETHAATGRSLSATKAEFLDIHERLKVFIETFIGNKFKDGFKTTLYKTKVIPLITGEVNKFLEPIDDIRLKIVVKNMKLVYFAEDRGNMPPFDNCSGYQKFIIGLGMRCALAKIGAVGQSLKHIFMDESFVACDSSNILKVGDILNELIRVGSYKSIMLMSHLDAIREVAYKQINIQRDGGKFSTVQYGKPYPKIKRGARKVGDVIIPPKARGRPKKIVAAVSF